MYDNIGREILEGDYIINNRNHVIGKVTSFTQHKLKYTIVSRVLPRRAGENTIEWHHMDIEGNTDAYPQDVTVIEPQGTAWFFDYLEFKEKRVHKD